MKLLVLLQRWHRLSPHPNSVQLTLLQQHEQHKHLLSSNLQLMSLMRRKMQQLTVEKEALAEHSLDLASYRHHDPPRHLAALCATFLCEVVDEDHAEDTCEGRDADHAGAAI